MAKNFDVFSNLNNFLDQDDVEMVEYDKTLFTPDTSILTSDSKESNVKATNATDVVDLSMDDDKIYEISPPKRSRRAADSIVNSVIETVELISEVSTQNNEMNNNRDRSKNSTVNNSVSALETEIVTRPKRSRRPPGKALPKIKRLTYKQALAVANAPIPNGHLASEISNIVQQTSMLATRSCDVDLTGDVVFTDKHSTAPLFQKQLVAPMHQNLKVDDIDLDDLDTIKIKVRTKTGIKSISHRRHQRYYDLFKTLADEDKIPVNNIFMFDGDKRIHHEDTPNSSNYKITTILNCRVMEAKPNEYKQDIKKNQIELKFQSDKWKKPIVVKMSKLDNFETAIEILCEQVSFKPAQITLRFDGDPVSLSETPIDLDFDGGEILDCGVKV